MSKQCTYIEGERGRNFKRYADARVCDEPALAGKSWCRRHYDRVFLKDPKTKDDGATNG